MKKSVRGAEKAGKKGALALALVVALAGCQRAEDGVQSLVQRYSEKFHPQPKPVMVPYTTLNFPEQTPGEYYPEESTYCYKVQTDILCYDRSIPGRDRQLVGYQVPAIPAHRGAGYGQGGYAAAVPPASRFGGGIAASKPLAPLETVEVVAPPQPVSVEALDAPKPLLRR